jgi:hypothetical protein
VLAGGLAPRQGVQDGSGRTTHHQLPATSRGETGASDLCSCFCFWLLSRCKKTSAAAHGHQASTAEPVHLHLGLDLLPPPPPPPRPSSWQLPLPPGPLLGDDSRFFNPLCSLLPAAMGELELKGGLLRIWPLCPFFPNWSPSSALRSVVQ